jgi:hypothetical protein
VSEDRKPRPGMAKAPAAALNLDLTVGTPHSAMGVALPHAVGRTK